MMSGKLELTDHYVAMTPAYVSMDGDILTEYYSPVYEG
jgi:hypothetical protein